MWKLLCITCLFGFSFLSGCELFSDRSNDYMVQERQPPLKVPDWYRQDQLNDRLPIPKAQKSFVATEDFVVPKPPEAGLEILGEQFSIRSLGSDTWLLANENPGRVWPAVREFWESVGGRIEDAEPGSGRMSVTLSGNSKRAAQFLTKLSQEASSTFSVSTLVEQGLKRRSSEVRMQIASDSSATSRRLLEEFKQFLDQKTSFESYSLQAQNLSSKSKVTLQDEGDEPYIKLLLSSDRAWLAVERALNQADIPLIDVNRSQGVFFVRYELGEQKESFLFSWLTSDDDEKLSDRFNYRLRLNTFDGEVRLTPESTKDGSTQAERLSLLNQILEHLS